jgi:hypothetical protein
MPLNATLTGSGWIVSIDTNGPRRAVTGNTVATAADVNGRIDVNSASPVLQRIRLALVPFRSWLDRA